MHKLILASSSPRRSMLLSQVGIPYEIRIPEVDESQVRFDSPESLVKGLARYKGLNTKLRDDWEVILSADTVVAYQNQILEKPQDQQDAIQMLKKLSGRQHEVYTGVMLRTKKEERVFVEKTTVEFRDLNDQEINRYVWTKDPMDKAGAYGIQSGGAVFVKGIFGDYYNVVGLPVARVVKELERYSIFPFSSGA